MKKALTFLIVTILTIGVAFPALGASAKYFSSKSLKGTARNSVGLYYTKASYAKYSVKHKVKLTARVNWRVGGNITTKIKRYLASDTGVRDAKTRYVFDRYVYNDYSQVRAVAYYASNW